MRFGQGVIVDSDIVNQAFPPPSLPLRVSANPHGKAVRVDIARSVFRDIKNAVHIQKYLIPVIHSDHMMPQVVVYSDGSLNITPPSPADIHTRACELNGVLFLDTLQPPGGIPLGLGLIDLLEIKTTPTITIIIAARYSIGGRSKKLDRVMKINTINIIMGRMLVLLFSIAATMIKELFTDLKFTKLND